MKEICKKIAIVVLVLGVIGSFALAAQLGKGYEYGFYDIQEERDWFMTIVYFISGVVSTGIFSVIFFALAEILEKLESLEYNSKPAARLNTTGFENDMKREEYMVNNGGWKCSRCGRINDMTVGSCACGALKE